MMKALDTDPSNYMLPLYVTLKFAIRYIIEED